MIVGIELTQPTPERLSVLHDELKRTSRPGAGTQQFASDLCETRQSFLTDPHNIPGRYKWIGNALPETKSPDRYLLHNKPLYETGDCLFGRQLYSRGCRKPILKIAGINHLIGQPQGDPRSWSVETHQGQLPGGRLADSGEPSTGVRRLPN